MEIHSFQRRRRKRSTIWKGKCPVDLHYQRNCSLDLVSPPATPTDSLTAILAPGPADAPPPASIRPLDDRERDIQWNEQFSSGDGGTLNNFGRLPYDPAL
jgi:hypothetical protein